MRKSEPPSKVSDRQCGSTLHAGDDLLNKLAQEDRPDIAMLPVVVDVSSALSVHVLEFPFHRDLSLVGEPYLNRPGVQGDLADFLADQEAEFVF